MKVLPYITTFTFLIFSSLTVSAKITKADYIAQWKDIAIEQMHSHGIPASITMAQGILESSYGNSMLAQKANNHFGIKCHTWNGDKVYKDDDKKDECFRKYSHALESFEDHSQFLSGRKRYADLFTFEVTDYKSWAKGLKKAGYATNPKYPQLLINIIEDNELFLLDQEPKDVDFTEITRLETERDKPEKSNVKLSKSKNYNIHSVKVNTAKTKFIVAKKGDTYYRIAKEFDLSLKQIYKYNDVISKKDKIEEGDKIYVMHKRNKAKDEKLYVVSESVSLREISQIKGVKLKKLKMYNPDLSATKKLDKDTKVFLR